jgi:hypothetical protein
VRPILREALRQCCIAGILSFIASSAVANLPLDCPGVMAHEPVKGAHPGWKVLSDGPARLSGAHVMYVVQSHYEGLLDPVSEVQLGDEAQSTVTTFDIAGNRRKGPFTLICLYGDYAQLMRPLPGEARACQTTRKKFLDETKGEGAYKVRCQ